MLQVLRNVGPMMTPPYKQPVGPMKVHSAVKQWPTLCSQHWPNKNDNVGPMLALPSLCDKQHWPTLAQHVGPTKAHSAVRWWANVVLPTLAQQSWQHCLNVGPTSSIMLSGLWFTFWLIVVTFECACTYVYQHIHVHSNFKNSDLSPRSLFVLVAGETGSR